MVRSRGRCAATCWIALTGVVMGGDGHEALVAQAAADLARREAAAAADVELVSFEAVVWPDASLGCPHPGMRYRQVPEDGARIVLKLRDRVYRYHSGGSRAPFLCLRESPETGSSGSKDGTKATGAEDR